MTLRQKELAREKLTETVQQLTVEYLDKKVEQFRPLVVFAESDLQDQLKKLTAQEESLRDALKAAESHLPARAEPMDDGEMAATTRRLASGGSWRSSSRPSGATRRKRRTRSTSTSLNCCSSTSCGPPGPGSINCSRPHRNRRRSELATWDTETSAALKALIGSTQAHLFRIDELRNELATIASKADAAKDGDPKLREAIADQQRFVEQMIRVHEANLVSIDASRRLHGKLRTEIDNGVALLSFEQLAHDAWRQCEYVWEYGLFSTGEAENLRLITVGKVVNVLVLFLVGLILSRRFSGSSPTGCCGGCTSAKTPPR